MFYKVIDRIGPMEEGVRAGTYLEAGEVVDESIFVAEHLPLLVGVGVLVEATLEDIAQDAARRADENADTVTLQAWRDEEGRFADQAADANGESETITHRKRKKAKED